MLSGIPPSGSHFDVNDLNDKRFGARPVQGRKPPRAAARGLSNWTIFLITALVAALLAMLLGGALAV